MTRLTYSTMLLTVGLVFFPACSDPSGSLRLVLGADPTLNSPQEITTAVSKLALIVDSPTGLLGVTKPGKRSSGGTALDIDDDGVLEVLFVTAVDNDLPVLELDLEANAGRELDIKALGLGSDDAVSLDAARALGGATVSAPVGKVTEIGVPFNLRSFYRAPRVVLSYPPDGGSLPVSVTSLTVVFSTPIDASSLANHVLLHCSGQGDVATTATLKDAVFVDLGGAQATRSQLDLELGVPLLGDPCTLRVGPGIISTWSKSFDQHPDHPGADAYEITFTPPGVASGGNCSSCPDGTYCDAVSERCKSYLDCSNGCAPGLLCDNSGTCVDDCRVYGTCPRFDERCDEATGLCS